MYGYVCVRERERERERVRDGVGSCVLQCVTECCRCLCQCVAVCCNGNDLQTLWRCVAVFFSVLQWQRFPDPLELCKGPTRIHTHIHTHMHAHTHTHVF